ncbi:MAG TPA: hypothetical protein VF135_09120, partial [Terriglobales bacterium]
MLPGRQEPEVSAAQPASVRVWERQASVRPLAMAPEVEFRRQEVVQAVVEPEHPLRAWVVQPARPQKLSASQRISLGPSPQQAVRPAP